MIDRRNDPKRKKDRESSLMSKSRGKAGSKSGKEPRGERCIIEALDNNACFIDGR